jgi:hypothetical protein
MRTNAEGNANRGGFNSSNSPHGNADMNRGSSARPTGRTWDAQGNSSDRGRPPAGFGNRPSSNVAPPTRGTGMTHSDRPPWAGTGNAPRSTMDRGNSPSNNGNVNRGGNSQRSYEPPQRSNSSRPPANYNYNPGYQGRGNSQPRSYNPPEPRSYASPRSYSAPSRGYPAPSHNYSAPSGRGYSAPSGRGSYSAPSHSYSAPSHSSGGGSSSHGGGGGGSSHGGGGGGGSSHTRH